MIVCEYRIEYFDDLASDPGSSVDAPAVSLVKVCMNRLLSPTRIYD